MKGQETKMLVAFSISNTMAVLTLETNNLSVSFLMPKTRPTMQPSTFAQIYFRYCGRRARKYSSLTHVHQLCIKITETA